MFRTEHREQYSQLASNAVGSSSLWTRCEKAHLHLEHCGVVGGVAMRSNGPENQPQFPAARVKHTAYASTGTTREKNAAHSTSRAPLQPHLHSSHATPRHTLNHHLSPAPRHVGHVHIGRRSSQSLARERHAGEHEAHSPERRTFRDNGAEGQQRLLPTEMRKKTLLAFDELERLHHTHDVSVKLLGRQHFAVGDDDN